MKNNQFVGKMVKQGNRIGILVPAPNKKDFKKFLGKSIIVTIEEI